MVSPDRCELLRSWSVSLKHIRYVCGANELNNREETLYFIIPPNVPAIVYAATKALLAPSELPAASGSTLVKWKSAPSDDWKLEKPLLTVSLPQSSGIPKQICWHRKGDYMATVCEWSKTQLAA